MERIAAPSEPPISLAEAKEHCRVEVGVTEDDALIAAYIEAAADRMERALDYALGEQVWRGTFDSFACALLKKRPFVSIEAVTYLDADGVERTLDPTGYRVRKRPDGVVMQPVDGWPSASSVTVDFKVGVSETPPALKVALLLHIGFLYANRESSSDASVRPTGAYDELTFPFNMSLM